MYQDLKLQYRLVYKSKNKMVSKKFKTFAAVSGAASALNGITRFIYAEFSAVDYSHSGTIYIYSKDNSRRVGSEFILKQVTQREAA